MRVTSDDTQVCPWCAETIKAAAIVCRYCGCDLPRADVESREDAFQRVRGQYGATFDTASAMLAGLPEPPKNPVAWVTELCNRITAGSPPDLAAEKIPLDWGAARDIRPRGPIPLVEGSFLERIRGIGDLRGYTRHDIVSLIGSPTSISAAANGGQLLQWQKTSAFGRSYHFALIFDGNGLCGGITHQFVR